MALSITVQSNETCEKCNRGDNGEKEPVLMIQVRHRGERDTIYIHASCFHRLARQAFNQAYIGGKALKLYEEVIR